MKKEELLKLKEKLEQKVIIIDEVDEQPITLYELELQKKDASLVVEYFQNYFEAIIRYYGRLGKTYDEIQLILGFGISFKEKDVNIANYPITYMPGAKPLNDLVKIQVNCFECLDNNQRFNADPETVYPNHCHQEFIVSFTELKKALEESGFILEEDASLESITEKIVTKKIPIFKLSFKFQKCKKLKNVIG